MMPATDTPLLGRLRDIAADELPLMLSWRNAPAVRQNMYTRHEISWDEHWAWWQRTQARTDQRYFMYEKDAVPLGIVGFTDIQPAHRRASWAFYASPTAPRGTGSKMEWLALDRAFGEFHLNKLCCEVLGFNTPVLRLHQKFGFVTEGVFRQHHWRDGEAVDVHALAILAPEWAAARPQLLQSLLQRHSEG